MATPSSSVYGLLLMLAMCCLVATTSGAACSVPQTPYRPPLWEAANSFKMVGTNTIGDASATIYVRQVGAFVAFFDIFFPFVSLFLTYA